MDALQTASEPFLLFRLRVRAEADPAALDRVLQPFQNMNIVPRRLLAEFASNGDLHVQIDISGISEERISLIAGKLGQAPCILHAHWSRL